MKELSPILYVPQTYLLDVLVEPFIPVRGVRTADELLINCRLRPYVLFQGIFLGPFEDKLLFQGCNLLLELGNLLSLLKYDVSFYLSPIRI